MTVYLWQTTTNQNPNNPEDDLLTLTTDEIDRAARFHRAIHRHRFIQGRAFLRHVLAAHTGARPQDLKFDTSPLGKPFLVNPADSSIQFNFSRSGESAVCAVTQHHAIGVDIELNKPLPDIVSTAQVIFNSSDYKTWLGLPRDQQLPSFYRAWSRKEALGKAHGSGIRLGPANLKVPLGAFDEGRTSIARIQNSRWSLSDWSTIPHTSASVVIGPLTNSVVPVIYQDFDHCRDNQINLPGVGSVIIPSDFDLTRRVYSSYTSLPK